MELEATTLWMSAQQREPDAAEFTVLLERAASGDAAAFDQIVVRHERRVLTLSWRLLGAMEDAQDAAQEVFLRAFKYLHRFDSRKPFEPWLIRMTVNVCRDIRRARQQRGAVFVETGKSYDQAEQTNHASDPHAELNSEQQRQVLQRALETLPEKERAAIVLRDIEGFTTAEVAEILGSSQGTVRSQISMARLKIRKILGGRR